MQHYPQQISATDSTKTPSPKAGLHVQRDVLSIGHRSPFCVIERVLLNLERNKLKYKRDYLNAYRCSYFEFGSKPE